LRTNIQLPASFSADTLSPGDLRESTVGFSKSVVGKLRAAT
jgi:hypothetical protein